MNIIETIRNKLNIVEVIGQVVALKQHGKEYIGSCPFHTEKTASFFVNSAKGVFYCFGCQEKGNVFDFYCKINNVNFNIALQHFAKQLNIELQPVSSKQVVEKSYKQQLMHFCSLANNYFVENLYNSKYASSLNYLISRGLTAEIIKQFSLGYSLQNNNELWDILYANGAKEEDLLEIGLKSYNSKGIIYEPFKNRIMFPIYNINNSIIGFGGRTMDNNVQPKYLNSKESIIFSKKENLYGVNFAINNLKQGNLIVVEGYMDVITLHLKGFNTAVASLGTAINLSHLNVINKLNATPYFCFDGDKAGQNATLKVAKMYLPLLSSTIMPKFVLLQEKDPDSFFINNDYTKFVNVLEQAYNTSNILWHFISKDKNLQIPEEATMVLEELLQLTEIVNNKTLKNQLQRFFKNQMFLGQNKHSLGKVPVKLQKYSSMVQYNKHYLLKGYLLISCIVKFAGILNNLEEKLANINFNIYKLEDEEINFNLQCLDNLRLFILENIHNINANNIVNVISDNSSALLWFNKIKDNNLYKVSYDSINTFEQALENALSVVNSLNLNYKVLDLNNANAQLSKLYEALKLIEDVNSNEYKDIHAKITVFVKQISLAKQQYAQELISITKGTKL